MNHIAKIPPQAIEFEQAVLGALLLEEKAIIGVNGFLSAESFYQESHQEIYAAIIELYQSSKPIDIITITNFLRGNGKLNLCGGPLYISQLTNNVSSAGNIEYHGRIIQQHYILRRLSTISNDLYNKSFEPGIDCFDLLQDAQSELLKIVSQNISGEAKSIANISKEAYANIISISQKEDSLLGVPSGITALDRVTSGFMPTDLIILAARPGMGKTTFALQIANNASKMGFPVDVYSLEMSAGQLVIKIYAATAQLNDYHIRNANLDEQGWEMLNRAVGIVERLPIHIDDTAGVSFTQLRSKCLRAKAERGTKLIIIDYLQLMTGDYKKNRNDQISDISRNLKLIAKETETPVIALSQLSRQVEQRGGDKRPMLSDLRDSGSIEQDADQVIFLYRPEYYGFDTDEEGRPTKDIAEIIIAKNRHGETTTVVCRTDLKHSTFKDIDNFTHNDPF